MQKALIRFARFIGNPAVRYVIRAAALAAYAAIAAASLVPRDYRPSSGVLPGAAEHAAAYFVLGLLTAAAARGKIALWRVVLFNVLFAAALELLQHAAPGRVASLTDFLASAAGAVAAAAMAAALFRRLPILENRGG